EGEHGPGRQDHPGEVAAPRHERRLRRPPRHRRLAHLPERLLLHLVRERDRRHRDLCLRRNPAPLRHRREPIRLQLEDAVERRLLPPQAHARRRLHALRELQPQIRARGRREPPPPRRQIGLTPTWTWLWWLPPSFV